VLNQNYSNIECIIVGDQSTDNSFSIVNNISKKDSRVKVHSRPYFFKKGANSCRNYGYKLSNSYEERVKAIKKSIKEHTKLKVLRHLNALRTLHKSNERLYNKLDKDLKFVQSYDEK
jgi:glycosyltransferase involved in cell wall biosynthesis